VHAGSEDVQAGAEVRERGTVVAAVGGTDGDGRGYPGGGGVAGVGVVVAGRDAVGDARRDRVGDRVVEGGVYTAAEAHVRYSRLARVGGHPVHTGRDAGCGAAAVAVQHPYGHQGHALGHAIRAAADRTGHVGAVTVTVVRGPARGHLVHAGDRPAT